MKHKITLSGINEPPLGPAALIVIGAGLLVWLILMPFVTCVGQGEVVVEDCGDAQTVWRAPKDQGLHWDGLCGTTTYHQAKDLPFNDVIGVDDVRVKLRGRLILRLPADDDDVRALHAKFGSDDALAEAIMPAAMADVRAAAADPAWHRTKGNLIQRGLKDAFEYGVRRVSPTGAIWSTHEAKKALEADIRRRLGRGSFSYGVTVDVELGFVTER